MHTTVKDNENDLNTSWIDQKHIGMVNFYLDYLEQVQDTYETCTDFNVYKFQSGDDFYSVAAIFASLQTKTDAVTNRIDESWFLRLDHAIQWLFVPF